MESLRRDSQGFFSAGAFLSKKRAIWTLDLLLSWVFFSRGLFFFKRKGPYKAAALPV